MAEPTTRPPVQDWATDFDHFDPEFVADPYPIFDDLRARCPVAHTDRYGGMEVLTTWADVAEAAHDPATFSSRRILVNEVPTSERGFPLPPINNDPPDHTGPRRAMLPFFNPVATKRWEQPIRDICARLLDGLEGRVECDLAVDYAQCVPGEITALMLGVPAEDAPTFRAWMHDLLEVGPTDTEVLRETTHVMVDYMRGLVATRRAGGGRSDGDGPGVGGGPEDLVTFLLGQEVDGVLLDDEELVSMLFLLLIAGIDTTWSAIGSSLLHLAAHPEDRRRLAADPSLIPTATEELLRAYAPVFVARVAAQDTELGGCPVDAGAWVMLAFNAANRDPAVFEDAEVVRIDREQNRHAAFGLGVHRCLGSNLARLEMNVAIEAWLARFPEFSLADPEAVTFSAGQVRGPRRIPARLG
ncbi:MAG: cytochrome P450 [Acidimicrobiia bacterium]|nr:cytochrome P450 [Acidimicrobiia bacterium]